MSKYKMKIYNTDKTEVLSTYDSSKGSLHNDTIVDEDGNVEYILVFTPFSAEKLAKTEALKQIARLKELLARSDYKAVKYAEGLISEEDYAPIKAQRQLWRDEINALMEG